jgi:hypothetical protein
MLFHGLAVIELFAVAAFQAFRPAPRHRSRINWIADPLPAQLQPDSSNWDYAESYDEAA